MALAQQDLNEALAEPQVIERTDKLCEALSAYMDAAQIAQIQQACAFGAKAHLGQKRLTGEPYILHPLAVASILAEMRMDHQSIVAAILHDVIEDTATAKDQIAHEFGPEVAELVDGVSKLTQFESSSPAEAQADNLRKMILAMTKDIRVILVKLADRLHNMRTLHVLPLAKKRQIARETLEIYAPIANRLGINMIRLELQDLGFSTLYPLRYRILAEAVRKARGNRKEIINKIEKAIQERLKQEGVNSSILGREKHLYSIYQKMHAKTLSFSEVYDVYAFRIVVDKVDTCYRTLGLIHNLYKPVPGKFKDYIAIPKTNGYQSLHTVLFGPFGVHIEVQIRSQDMDKVAERGIAAHWLYKTGDGPKTSAQSKTRDWLRQLLEIQKHAGNSLEFIENVKIDLFPDAVYVFTPKGDIMELPYGATLVDFAYAVHTDVGDRCVAAKINRHLASLRTPLSSGQTVEIITAPGARPNPTWLNFVVTAKARGNVRHFLKNLKHEESELLGKRLLDQALAAFNTSLSQLPENRLQNYLRDIKVNSKEELLREVGLGNRMAPLVARSLAATEELRGVENTSLSPSTPLIIKGTEGMVVTFAKCCYPIPGDNIVGFISTGKGIVIHTQNCKNTAEFRDRPEKWIEVDWAKGIEREFPVYVSVESLNQRGVLATVAAAIADTNANIENVNIDEKDGRTSTIHFVLDVHNRQHLARIIRRIRMLDTVLKISRGKISKKTNLG